MNKKFVYQVGNNKKVINLPVDRSVTSRFYFHISHLQILPYAQHKSRCQIYKQGKKKLKVTLVQALRLCTGRTAYRWITGIALLFHDQRH